MKHNQKVTCEIHGIKITDARISIDEDGLPFICQNEQNGFSADDKLGYKYSWGLNRDFTASAVTNLRPLEKDWDTLQMKHNQKVTCEINGIKITDARISIDEYGTPYICQNEKSGAYTEDKLGYNYSWQLNRDFTQWTVTNLRPAGKDWDNLQIGDEIGHRHEKRTVLGVCGRVIFISWPCNKDRYFGGNTKKELIECGYTIVQDTPPIIEISLQDIADLKGVDVKSIKII